MRADKRVQTWNQREARFRKVGEENQHGDIAVASFLMKNHLLLTEYCRFLKTLVKMSEFNDKLGFKRISIGIVDK
jgi:hypothetical protein